MLKALSGYRLIAIVFCFWDDSGKVLVVPVIAAL